MVIAPAYANFLQRMVFHVFHAEENENASTSGILKHRIERLETL